MKKYQHYIKQLREQKSLSIEAVSNAINLSEDTIKMIEESDNNKLFIMSSSVLKNYFRRYCEFLEIRENKIITILNKIDIIAYKKSKLGKLTFFDYLNRFVILCLISAICFLCYKIYRNNIIEQKKIQNSPTEIIYTPVDYDNSGENISLSTKKISTPKTANLSNFTINNNSQEKSVFAKK